MKACECIFRDGCRYQQELYAVERKAGAAIEVVFADSVGCDDIKIDMDVRCYRFVPKSAFRPIDLKKELVAKGEPNAEAKNR